MTTTRLATLALLLAAIVLGGCCGDVGWNEPGPDRVNPTQIGNPLANGR